MWPPRLLNKPCVVFCIKNKKFWAVLLLWQTILVDKIGVCCCRDRCRATGRSSSAEQAKAEAVASELVKAKAAVAKLANTEDAAAELAKAEAAAAAELVKTETATAVLAMAEATAPKLA